MRTPLIRTPLARSLVLVATAAVLTGCGGSDTTATDSESPAASSSAASPTGSAPTSPTEQAEPAGTVVDITIEGGDVNPKGDRVEADLGAPVTLRISSDRAGELHVHSTPEQEVSFDAGTTTKKLTFEQPGVVEVEDHESGTVIVQLQVS